jgi:hypothetical protein
MKKHIMIATASVFAQLALAGAAHAALVDVTGNSVNANPAVCANVASTGDCTASSQQTVNTTAAPASAGPAATVGGNTVNVNPAICANVLSAGNCTSTAQQTVTSVAAPVVPTTGGGLPGLVGTVANVSGNSVNVNPAICANVLSAGNCVATAVQTVTNSLVGGLGGGVLAAAQSPLGLGGSLPDTGSAGWSLLLSILGAAGSAIYAARRNLAFANR